MPVLPASTMAGAVLALSPRWLNEGNNRKLMTVLGDAQSDGLDKMRQGMKAHMPGVGTPTALPFIGDDRVLPRGNGESDDSYAARLRMAFQTWQHAGSARAVMSQVIVYTGNYITKPANWGQLTQSIHNSAGTTWTTWDTYQYNSDVALPPNHITVAGNWNWDNTYDWWRTWLVIHSTPGSIIAPARAWGSGSWGEPGISWGFNVTSEFFSGLRRIVRQWKSAATYYPWIIFDFNGGDGVSSAPQFMPSNNSGTGNPTGDWGRWGTVVSGGNYAPSRPSTMRFADGSDQPLLSQFAPATSVSTDGIGPIMSTAFATADVAFAVGDCVAITAAGHATLALSAALIAAGAVIGVAIAPAVPGGTVIIQTDGILSAFTSGLVAAGPVDVNPATGRLRTVASFAPDSYPIGYSTSSGIVTMVRGLALNVHGPYVYNQDGGLIADYNADLTTAGALAAWNDSSGSLNHLLQATGANQPTSVAAILNGRKIVRFNGTTGFMRRSGFNLNANEFSAYVVASLAAVGSNPVLLGYNVSTVIVNHSGASGFPSLSRGAGTASYAHNIVSEGFAVRSSQCRNDGSNEIFYQGTSRGTATDSTAIPTTGTTLDVGALNNGAGFFFQGDIARILIYNKRHTTTVRQAIEAQLLIDYQL